MSNNTIEALKLLTYLLTYLKHAKI